MAVTRETERMVLLRRLIETGSVQNRARAQVRLAEIYLLQGDRTTARKLILTVDLSKLDKVDKFGVLSLREQLLPE